MAAVTSTTTSAPSMIRTKTAAPRASRANSMSARDSAPPCWTMDAPPLGRRPPSPGSDGLCIGDRIVPEIADMCVPFPLPVLRGRVRVGAVCQPAHHPSPPPEYREREIQASADRIAHHLYPRADNPE